MKAQPLVVMLQWKALSALAIEARGSSHVFFLLLAVDKLLDIDNISQLDNILQLKTLWAMMMDNGSIGLGPIIEPYEDFLCETFEECWLHNHWHMPQDDCGEKYELLSETDDKGKKYYYTLVHTTDAYGGKSTNKLSWGAFFYELVLNHWILDAGSTCRYSESAGLKKIIELISS